MYNTTDSLRTCTIQLTLYEHAHYNYMFTHNHSTIVSLRTITVQLSLYAHVQYN